MARIVLQAVGYAVGSYFGYPQLGAFLGSLAGAAIEGNQTTRYEGPKIADLRVTGFEYGDPIAYVKGHPVLAGQIWWASNRRAIATTTEQGGKGGGPTVETTTYTYEVDLLIGFTSNPMAALLRLWLSGKLAFNVRADATDAALANSAAGPNWRRLTFYDGNASQLPDPTYEAAVGVGNAPAYRGRCSLFIEGLQLGASGQIPNITAELASSGTAGAVGYNDNFSGGVSAYTPVVGTADYFFGANDSYGPTIELDASSTAANVDNYIERTVPTVSASGVRLKFIIRSLSDDDAGLFGFYTAGGTIQFFFNPRREVNFDSLSRPELVLAGSTFSLGSAALDVGAWFQLEVDINAGANASTAKIKRLSDGATIISQNLTGTFTPFTTARQRFGINQSAGEIMSPTAYSDLQALGQRATITEETLQSVASALCQRAGLQTSQFDVTALASITKPVRAMAISQLASARQVLEMLAATYFFECVLSDKLYFRPRGGAAVATIPYAQLGASSSEEGDPEPFAIKPADDLEVPAGWALSYMNVDADCSKDTQQSDRLITSSRTIEAREVPLGFTAAEAKAIVDAWRDDALIAAMGTTRIALLMHHAANEPADVINAVHSDGSTFRLRLVKLLEQQGVRAFDAVLDDAQPFTQAGVTSTDYAGSSTVSVPADTAIELMDMPILRDADNDAGFYVAAKGSASPWPGAKVFTSPDDVTYTDRVAVTEAAVFGSCTSALPDWTGGNVFDEVSTLTVDVGAGELASATRDEVLDQEANAALVGSEVIQFRSAALITGGRYLLSGLLRGRRGTEWASTGHAASEKFILLRTSGLRRLAVQTNEIGALRYVKGVTLGRLLSSAAARQITPAAKGLEPYSPVDIRAARAAGDAVALLLHMNGTNGSTTIPDTSLNAHTVTANGNAALSTATPKFGTAACAFDGTGDYLSVGSAASWTFLHNGSTWTIEGWFKFTNFSATVPLMDTGQGTTSNVGIYIEVNTSRQVGLQVFRGVGGTNVVSGSFTTTLVPNDTNWHHIAITFDHSLASANATCFVDGVLAGTLNKSGNAPSASAPSVALQVGRFSGAGAHFNGQMDDLRITSGQRVYTANFTPPAAEFSDPAAGTGDITLTASRRTRLAKNFTNGATPLGEASERYDIEIYNNSGFSTVVRTISGLTTPSALYTGAQQTTDFGSVQSVVHLRWYQLSETVGRGYAGQASV